ncbi:DUF5947 family protein [Kribbella kalugense]|uniref:Uncharacterized protein n=1 Tax=Kribbella kalugense TaxID=2512221 RepID=A0A4R7ZJI7_9ACTN|nr:DUF5947 family protein [Kribbella kalugense]TDW15270.1 hypothetical protein EV650_6752 [Kribbella kalugense]
MRPPSTLRALAQNKPPPVVDPVAVLRQFTGGVREQGAPGEQCEMCTARIGPEHSHLADVEGHRLLCTCRPCYLLFTDGGASHGHYRAVPERYRANADFTLSTAQWETMGIPVNLAFLFYQSDQGRYVAFYPSPGGATESLLDLAGWDEVVAGDARLQELVPDVEAVLLRRLDNGFECHLVPIDACYELVGIVRQYWEGFAGGEDVWRRIDEFFDGVRERGRG